MKKGVIILSSFIILFLTFYLSKVFLVFIIRTVWTLSQTSQRIGVVAKLRSCLPYLNFPYEAV